MVLKASLSPIVLLATPPATSPEESVGVVLPGRHHPPSIAADPTVLERYDPLRSTNKVRGPYDPNKALDDSKMIKSVAPLREGGPKMERLYIMTG